jgi:hypothetical protein
LGNRILLLVYRSRVRYSSVMQGVTTALVLFLFTCVVFPNLVKNRPQYYAALAAVCLIILLDALATAVRETGFTVFAYIAVACLQVGAILLLFLAAGGITWRQLADDMRGAYEVVRRGETEKTLIVPLSRQASRQAVREEPLVERITIETPSPEQPKPQESPSQS